MTHDPLCGYYTVPNAAPRPCPRCDLIDRVREDERERAHKVIDRFDMFSDDREAMHAWIDGTPPDWWTETSNG